MRGVSYESLETFLKDPLVVAWVVQRLREEALVAGRAKEIALHLGLTQGHMSNVISGRRPPGSATVGRLLDLWRVGTDELRRIAKGKANEPARVRRVRHEGAA